YLNNPPDVVRNCKSNQIFRTILGGKVQLIYAIGRNLAVEKEALVPGKKIVRVHAVILKSGNKVLMGEPYAPNRFARGHYDPRFAFDDIDGDKKYTPFLSEEMAKVRVVRDEMMVNEIYAQVGVDVRFTIEVKTLPATASDSLKAGAITKSIKAIVNNDSLNATEKELLTAGFNSPSRTDIEAYYVKSIYNPLRNGYPQGTAYFPEVYGKLTIQDATDSMLISDS